MFRILISVIALYTLSGCVFIDLFPSPGPLEEVPVTGTGNDKVLVVEVSGLISSASSSGLLDKPSLTARFKEELTQAGEDPSVKALVLRINSPGGTVTASDILYHEIQLFKEKRQIPIVASIMDLGTSGGYYVAVAADSIVAHPSTVTGSLGVIMLTLNAAGLLEKIGIEPAAVVSGPKKDMGSPFRTMTDEERAIFQSVIDSFYDRFLKVIEKGRLTLTAEEIRRIADGRIYSAVQAKQLGLVDEIGYVDDAIELAKRRANLAEATVVMYRRPGGYTDNVYSKLLGNGTGLGMFPELNMLSIRTLLGGGTPQFMYLWMP